MRQAAGSRGVRNRAERALLPCPARRSLHWDSKLWARFGPGLSTFGLGLSVRVLGPLS
jgi:hypothetical protein